MPQPVRILVVDDERVVCDLMVQILATEGYEIETSTDALAALDLLKSRDDFSLLLTDICMPEMDGIRLIHEARQVRPGLVPVVMTGFATLETARAAVKEGAYDYVLKPFSISEVRLAVSKALERRRLVEENTRLRELSSLLNFSETVSRTWEEGALLQFVLRAGLERVGAERGSLMVATPDGHGLRVAASVGLPEEADGRVVGLSSGIAGWVAQHGQPVLVDSLRAYPDLARRSLGLPEQSFVSVPLERRHARTVVEPFPQHGARVLVVLNATRKKGGAAFDDSDLKILTIVANHAAGALENARLVRDVENAHLTTLQSMALLLEARDSYTHGHSQRVRQYCVIAAREVGVSEDEIYRLQLGAALHDIGKIGVSDAVLNKPGSLNAEELQLIRRHPIIGFEVLSPVCSLAPVHLELVRSHHERPDGRGYPDGLTDGELPPLVRIMAVADAYDAMASDRAYRPAMSAERIIEEIDRGSGTQFDDEVANVFMRLIDSGDILRPQSGMFSRPIAANVI